MKRFRKIGLKKARKKALRMMKTSEHIKLSESSVEIIDTCLRYFMKYYETLTEEQLDEVFNVAKKDA